MVTKRKKHWSLAKWCQNSYKRVLQIRRCDVTECHQSIHYWELFTARNCQQTKPGIKENKCSKEQHPSPWYLRLLQSQNKHIRKTLQHQTFRTRKWKPAEKTSGKAWTCAEISRPVPRNVPVSRKTTVTIEFSLPQHLQSPQEIWCPSKHGRPS